MSHLIFVVFLYLLYSFDIKLVFNKRGAPKAPPTHYHINFISKEYKKHKNTTKIKWLTQKYNKNQMTHYICWGLDDLRPIGWLRTTHSTRQGSPTRYRWVGGQTVRLGWLTLDFAGAGGNIFSYFGSQRHKKGISETGGGLFILYFQARGAGVGPDSGSAKETT